MITLAVAANAGRWWGVLPGGISHQGYFGRLAADRFTFARLHMFYHEHFGICLVR